MHHARNESSVAGPDLISGPIIAVTNKICSLVSALQLIDSSELGLVGWFHHTMTWRAREVDMRLPSPCGHLSNCYGNKKIS